MRFNAQDSMEFEYSLSFIVQICVENKIHSNFRPINDSVMY